MPSEPHHFHHIATYYRWRYEVSGCFVPLSVLAQQSWYVLASLPMLRQ